MTRLTNSKAAARELMATTPGLTYAQALQRVKTQTPAFPALSKDWEGRMVDGYTDDDMDSFMSHIFEVTGIEMVCIWEYLDDYGFGGSSQWYIVERDDNLNILLFEVEGDLWEWASTEVTDPEHPANPGTVESWKGLPSVMPEGPVEFSGSNWVWEDQTADSDEEDSVCHECGKPMFLTDAEVSHHASDESFDGIDHDADADHVAFTVED